MMRNRIVGLAASAVALLALLLVFHPPRLPWQSVFSFRIATPAFSQLQPGATVDLAGKQVGQLDSLTVENGLPMLTVHVDAADAHLLHDDASATIAPHGLLGTQYIELDGGSVGALPDGGLIPASRVRVAVTLDQVLNVFQSTERQNLQTLIVQLGTASANRGQDLNQTLQALGDASTSLSQVTGTVRQHDRGLSLIIDSSQRLNQSLQDAPLGAQIADTDQVLAGLATVDGSIGHGIDHTAAVLSDLDVILRGNTGNLRYALARAPQVTAQLRTLLAEGNTLLKGINPALPALLISVVEAESAFGGADANGHFVRVMSVTGTCTAGLNLGCSGGPAHGGPPVPVPGVPGSPASGVPPSGLSDRALMNLLFGNG
jgi:phospholipid/cholesterol/gamma-HCH transport system substrate-binding protein